LKGEIDVTRTVQEVEFEKTIEKEIIKDEKHYTDSRKEYLSNTVQELNDRFNQKKEKLRTRRHSVAKVHQEDDDEDRSKSVLVLPSIKNREPEMLRVLLGPNEVQEALKRPVK
jgi:hypothetical protein